MSEAGLFEPKISVSECMAMRVLSVGDYSYREISELFGTSESTVGKHVRGKCEIHAGEDESVAARERCSLSVEECLAARLLHRADYSKTTLSMIFELGESNVGTHVNGGCSMHADTNSPLSSATTIPVHTDD